MLIYLLKSSACLAIFMIFYKLFLEKTSVHTFKRLYLLSVLIIAFAIPSLTFIEYIEPVIISNTEVFATTSFEIVETLPEETPIDSTPIILWSIYGLGVFIFLLKFCINLSRIISRIRSNPKYRSANFINVLVKNLITPHTFFSYIFLNKREFENSEIPKEVILHEQAHAKQKHSIDVLVLELLQILFWFNPLIYLLKRDIKLNHEFLADHAVLRNGIKPSAYQQLLLAFSSNASEPQLANAINYSSIKKRFTVMKTTTSKTSIWLRSLLVIPLIALTLYGFSEKIEVEKEEPPVESLDLYLNDNNKLLKDNEVITFETIENLFQINNKLEVAIKYNLKNQSINSETLVLKLREIGVKKITICSSKDAIPNSTFQSNLKASKEQIDEYNRLAKHYNSQPKDKRIIKKKVLERLETLYGLMSDEQKKDAQPFPECPSPPPPTMDTIYTYHRLSKRIQIVSENRKANIAYLKDLYNKMNTTQKSKVKSPKEVLKQLKESINEEEWLKVKEHLNPKKQNNSNNLSDQIPPPIPDNATPEQRKKKKAVIDEYEKTHKRKVHTGKAIGTGENINFIVNDEEYEPTKIQNEDIKTGFIKINGQLNYYITINNITRYYNRKGYEVSKNGNIISKNQINASDIIPGQYITKVYSDSEIVAEFNDNKPNNQHNSIDIPTPIKSISPLDHIINMAKKDAVFFYEGRKTSSDKAIKLLKKNSKLNIFTKDITTNKPRVFLTKDTRVPKNNDDIKATPKPNHNNIVSHIKVMNRHGAKFFFGKKEITFNEALTYVRKHKDADVSSSTDKNVTVISPPKQKKSKELVKVNGKTPVEGQLILRSYDFKKLKLTLDAGEITSFKFKAPDKPTQNISGNTLNATSKTYIKEIPKGGVVHFFDIKDSKGFIHESIIVKISGKLVGVKGKSLTPKKI